MNEEKAIRLDRMRFTKNSLPASLALLAIIFNVLYFANIYESNVGSWYYNILMGASILYNLIFMLAAFLSSEGIKNYKIGYAFLMVALGIGQIIRIFIYPMKAHAATVTIQEQAVTVMETKQFTICVVYLLISAACLLAGAVIGIIRSRALQAHMASLNAQGA
ncbi:MAG: hypothetical protein IJI71_09775 [Clostridia bacterium]|nr:hypothetical protein [Clostridia bacterium]MBR0200150.1 hypothetical protein [Oscillospiraceae bacterium]